MKSSMLLSTILVHGFCGQCFATASTCTGMDFALWNADNDVFVSDITNGDDFCVERGQFAVEVRPLGCSEDSIGNVVISTMGSKFFKNTEFNERGAPYYSFGNRNEAPFVHGRNRKPTSFTVSAVVHDKQGEIIGKDSINFSFSSTACSSNCVSTERELRNRLTSAPEGSVVLICENTSINVGAPLSTSTSSLTLACAGGNCALSKTRTILLEVYGTEFSLHGITFLNKEGSAGTMVRISAAGPHTISDCEFRGAKSVNNASLYADTGIETSGAGSISIQNSVFADNESSGAYLQGFDQVAVVGCTFDKNVGRHLNVRPPYENYAYGESVTIEDSSFTDSLTTWNGAGVNIWKYHDVQIERCVFANNKGLRGGGGGLAVSHAFTGVKRAETLTITDCTFISNENEEGGALRHFRFKPLYPVTLTLLNNVFEDNTSTRGGGVISGRQSVSTAPYFHLIAEGNTAVGNSECDGFYDYNDRQCFPFE